MLIKKRKDTRDTIDTIENFCEINDVEFDGEIEHEKFKELEDPYNELYFYLFENVLEDYMKNNFTKNKNKMEKIN